MPGQAARTEGNIFLNVTFGENNNAINGSVYDRSIVDTGQALPSIVLVATDIAADGTFLGQVEYDGILNNNIGDYGGIFGGPNAESVAGVVSLEEFDNDTLGFDNELEIGVFVLDQCGTPDAIDPLCANVNP
ncbi:hypothetical protein [Lentibacter sp. XHP0401]|uniref:hypothetical protein n=1 Tax=Lentibacter sp. XHP0401 TaxID=2984334 RepID=UPI0021E7E587|nr:hypothetical protein [Lentibacter sp. XHP0401]MCV2893283.1 hypothetical protein [Lentibacter sp. XHP0401]